MEKTWPRNLLKDPVPAVPVPQPGPQPRPPPGAGSGGCSSPGTPSAQGLPAASPLPGKPNSSGSSCLKPPQHGFRAATLYYYYFFLSLPRNTQLFPQLSSPPASGAAFSTGRCSLQFIIGFRTSPGGPAPGSTFYLSLEATRWHRCGEPTAAAISPARHKPPRGRRAGP